MNFYFLLEDEKSFLKVLPSWLEYMNFIGKRVADIHDVQENNYVLQSGQGVTQLVTKALFDTIDTILLNPDKIDELVIILIRYSKSNPKNVATKNYFEGIVERINTTEHLKSFKNFYNYVSDIK